MSSSRTTAAQRRRNGPPDLQGSRGPATSIQSTSAFAQPPQIRPGTTGRLAGQQASLAQNQNQQQQKQQQQQQQQQQKPASSNGTLSVPQAITLITLRLGRLESQIQSLEAPEQSVNNQIIEHIIQRLDILEQKSSETDSIKQNIELIKPVLANTKTLATNSSKELKDFKLALDKMKTEFLSLQNIVGFLQTFISNGDNSNDCELNTPEILEESEPYTAELSNEEIPDNELDNTEITNTLTSNFDLREIVLSESN